MSKNTIYLIIIAGLLLAIGIVSCQDQEVDQTEYLNNFNDLITETDGADYKGALKSFVTDSNEIGIKLMGDVNKLYILQRYTAPDKLNIDTKYGQVIYLKDALVVNSINPNKIYYFGVTNKDQEISEKVKSKVSLSNEIRGYGLSQMNIDSFDKYNFQTDKSIYYSLLEATGKTSNEIDLLLSDCTAGGPGSTSCSVTGPSGSCSVSCSSGYACCNAVALSCKCVGDASQIDPG